jgi:hypothetical protein
MAPRVVIHCGHATCQDANATRQIRFQDRDTIAPRLRPAIPHLAANLLAANLRDPSLGAGAASGRAWLGNVYRLTRC